MLNMFLKLFLEIATVGSTNSTIRTSSTKSEEPASKKVFFILHTYGLI